MLDFQQNLDYWLDIVQTYTEDPKFREVTRQLTEIQESESWTSDDIHKRLSGLKIGESLRMVGKKLPSSERRQSANLVYEFHKTVDALELYVIDTSELQEDHEKREIVSGYEVIKKRGLPVVAYKLSNVDASTSRVLKAFVERLVSIRDSQEQDDSKKLYTLFDRLSVQFSVKKVAPSRYAQSAVTVSTETLYAQGSAKAIDLIVRQQLTKAQYKTTKLIITRKILAEKIGRLSSLVHASDFSYKKEVLTLCRKFARHLINSKELYYSLGLVDKFNEHKDFITTEIEKLETIIKESSEAAIASASRIAQPAQADASKQVLRRCDVDLCSEVDASFSFAQRHAHDRSLTSGFLRAQVNGLIAHLQLADILQPYRGALDSAMDSIVDRLSEEPSTSSQVAGILRSVQRPVDDLHAPLMPHMPHSSARIVEERTVVPVDFTRELPDPAEITDTTFESSVETITRKLWSLGFNVRRLDAARFNYLIKYISRLTINITESPLSQQDLEKKLASLQGLKDCLESSRRTYEAAHPLDILVQAKIIELSMTLINKAIPDSDSSKGYKDVLNNFAIYQLDALLSSSVAGFLDVESQQQIVAIRQEISKKYLSGSPKRLTKKELMDALRCYYLSKLTQEEYSALLETVSRNKKFEKFEHIPGAASGLKFFELDVLDTYFEPGEFNTVAEKDKFDRIKKATELSSVLKLEDCIVNLVSTNREHRYTWRCIDINLPSIRPELKSELTKIILDPHVGRSRDLFKRAYDFVASACGMRSDGLRVGNNVLLPIEDASTIPIQSLETKTYGYTHERVKDASYATDLFAGEDVYVYGASDDARSVAALRAGNGKDLKLSTGVRKFFEPLAYASLGLVGVIDYYIDNLELLHDTTELHRLTAALLHPRYLLTADFDKVARKKLLELVRDSQKYFKSFAPAYVIYVVTQSFAFIGDRSGLQKMLEIINKELDQEISEDHYYLLHLAKLNAIFALSKSTKEVTAHDYQSALESYTVVLESECSAISLPRWTKFQAEASFSYIRELIQDLPSHDGASHSPVRRRPRAIFKSDAIPRSMLDHPFVKSFLNGKTPSKILKLNTDKYQFEVPGNKDKYQIDRSTGNPEIFCIKGGEETSVTYKLVPNCDDLLSMTYNPVLTWEDAAGNGKIVDRDSGKELYSYCKNPHDSSALIWCDLRESDEIFILLSRIHVPKDSSFQAIVWRSDEATKIEFPSIQRVFKLVDDVFTTGDGWQISTDCALSGQLPAGVLVLTKPGEKDYRCFLDTMDGSNPIEFTFSLEHGASAEKVCDSLKLAQSLISAGKTQLAEKIYKILHKCTKSDELKKVLATYNQNVPSGTMALQAGLSLITSYGQSMVALHSADFRFKHKILQWIYSKVLPKFIAKSQLKIFILLGSKILESLQLIESHVVSQEMLTFLTGLSSNYKGYIKKCSSISVEERLTVDEERSLLSFLESTDDSCAIFSARKAQLMRERSKPEDLLTRIKSDDPSVMVKALLWLVKKIASFFMGKLSISNMPNSKEILEELFKVDISGNIDVQTGRLKRFLKGKVYSFDIDSLSVWGGTEEDYNKLLKYYKDILADGTKLVDPKLVAYAKKTLGYYMHVLNLDMGVKDNKFYTMLYIILAHSKNPNYIRDTHDQMEDHNKREHARVARYARYYALTSTPELLNFNRDGGEIFKYWSRATLKVSFNVPKADFKQMQRVVPAKSYYSSGIEVDHAQMGVGFDVSRIDLAYAPDLAKIFEVKPVRITSRAHRKEADFISDSAKFAESKQKAKLKVIHDFREYCQDTNGADRIATLDKNIQDQITLAEQDLDRLNTSYQGIQQAIEAQTQSALRLVAKSRKKLPQNLGDLLVYFVINKYNFEKFCKEFELNREQAQKIQQLVLAYGNKFLLKRRLEKIKSISSRSADRTLEIIDIDELCNLLSEPVGANNSVELAFQSGAEGLDYWSLQRGVLDKFQREDDSGVLAQLIMGSGKTKAIAPTIAAAHAASGALSMVVVPAPLFVINYVDLQQRMTEKFGVSVYPVEFDRNACSKPEYAQYLYERLVNTKESNGVVIATSKTLLSIRLKYFEYCRETGSLSASDKKTRDYLKKTLDLIHADGRMLIDEADTVLRIKNPLIYRLASDKPNLLLQALFVDLYNNLSKFQCALEGHGDHEISLFDLINGDAYSLSDSDIKKYLEQFLRTKLLSKDGADGRMYQRLKKLLNNRDLTTPELDAIINYLLYPEESLPKIIRELKLDQKNKEDLVEVISFYRGMLGTILPATLRRKYNENYGPDKDSFKAIPYNGPQRPAYGHDFGTIEESMAYSIQQLLITGLSGELLNQFIQDSYKSSVLELSMKLAKTLEDTPTSKMFVELTGFKLTDLYNDPEAQAKYLTQINKELIENKNALPIIWHILKFKLLPTLDTDVESLGACSHDLIAMVQSGRAQGFTGTPWNHDTYKELSFAKSSENQAIDGEAIAKLKLPKNTMKVSEIAVDASLEDIIKDCVQSPQTQAIIDVGAKLRQYKNSEVARQVLDHIANNYTGSPIKFVLYFDGDDLYALEKIDDTNYKKTKIGASDWAAVSAKLNITDPLQIFTFFDKAHTVGVDLKFARQARATVLINNHTCLFELLQGGLRMRGLDADGQSLDFMIDRELDKLAKARLSRSSETELSIDDIVAFTYSNQKERLLKEQIMSARKHMISLAADYILRNHPPHVVERMLAMTSWVSEKRSDRLFTKFGSAEKEVSVKSVLEITYAEIEADLNRILGLDSSSKTKSVMRKIQAVKNAAIKDIGHERVRSKEKALDTQVEHEKELAKEQEQEKEIEIEIEVVSVIGHAKKPIDPEWIDKLQTSAKRSLLLLVSKDIVQLDSATSGKFKFDTNIFLSRDFAHSFDCSLLEPNVFYKGAKDPYYIVVKQLEDSTVPLVTIVSAKEAAYCMQHFGKEAFKGLHIQTVTGDVLAGAAPSGWATSNANIRILEQVNYFRGDFAGLCRFIDTKNDASWLLEDTKKKLAAAKEIAFLRVTNFQKELADLIQTKLNAIAERKPASSSYIKGNFLGNLGLFNIYNYLYLKTFIGTLRKTLDRIRVCLWKYGLIIGAVAYVALTAASWILIFAGIGAIITILAKLFLVFSPVLACILIPLFFTCGDLLKNIMSCDKEISINDLYDAMKPRMPVVSAQKEGRSPPAKDSKLGRTVRFSLPASAAEPELAPASAPAIRLSRV
ncbi:MAG: DUF3638 domain-containing protein [Gammaproteobacteria bacterium]|nr:DUF3638 domain-containing protein [Gammaproteobacteria bacterium]